LNPLAASAQSSNLVAVRTSYSDVSTSYWARGYIDELSNRSIITGFTDGSYRPNALVTRAEFSTMVARAFRNNPKRQTLVFSDVSSNSWAAGAIAMAYSNGFLDAPSGQFRPNDVVMRQDALGGLCSGLDLRASRPVDTTLALYRDASSIDFVTRDRLAAATERNLVVNYPDVTALNPRSALTRAEAAAFLYQALATQGQVVAIASPYVVNLPVTPPPVVAQAAVLRSGTLLPVRYDKGEKILLKPDERMPLSLTVTQAVVDRGVVVIPAGSQLVGELRPSEGGTQFVASEVVVNGVRTPVSAVSNVVTEREIVRRGVNLGSVLKGAVLGGGAATLVGGVTGDRRIRPWQVLTGVFGGAAVGAVTDKNRVELVSVKPEALQVVLRGDFTGR
jgi:hypothetical protein